jgi:DNA-binding MarR family transcriptional regulator
MKTPSGGVAASAPHPGSAQAGIAYLIGRLDRVLRQQLGARTAQFGLTAAQYTALSVLKTKGPLSNAKLARRALITPQAMNELVKALEQKGLVARRPDPDHGRVVQMLLTPVGETLVSKCDRVVRQLEDRMLQHVAGTDRGKLRGVLWACITSLEQA